MPRIAAVDDFFADRRRLMLDPGAVLLGGFALPAEHVLLDVVLAIAAAAAFRHLEIPGGRRMSVAMTNAGRLGWVSDRRGYRYAPADPLGGDAWPAIPPALAELAHDAARTAGYDGFAPEACLVNRYAPGSRMSLHQDRDERNLHQPIVSVSLGVDARFLWGGRARGDRPRRIALHHGDVVVWGGPARLTFHGGDPLARSVHPLTGMLRYNLTCARAA